MTQQDQVELTGWQFAIDRGGTFTDVIARTPDGAVKTRKLLSENPDQYEDAAVQAIRDFLGLDAQEKLDNASINRVRMGTTVATNALLERKGEKTAFVTTRGLGDILRIGNQNRPHLFVRHIEKPAQLYTSVIEIDARMDATGNEITPPDLAHARTALVKARDQGCMSVAICLMHGYRNPEHERQIGALAEGLGFAHISMSHQVISLMKLVGRASTTVADAYLTPVLRAYVDRISKHLPDDKTSTTQLQFMMSSGGLTAADLFQGKDAVLSGPAGGVVGAVQVGSEAGFDRLIGFDMGGTSTDVCHFAGAYERNFDSDVAGIALRAPMMRLHTVAAGGGSILRYEAGRFRVGPESAGAYPGPVAYRNGGPLSVTDANIITGRINPDDFPALFGPDGDAPLDSDATRDAFEQLAEHVAAATGQHQTVEALAEGFLHIANENMAQAIKKISVQRGYDISKYALVCFGGAGGQHACDVADLLDMDTVLVHPMSGLLSAWGIDKAAVRALREDAVERPLDDDCLTQLTRQLETLQISAEAELAAQGLACATRTRTALIRYEGSDTALPVAFGALADMQTTFQTAHRQQFGFVYEDRQLIVEALTIECVSAEAKTKAPSMETPKVDASLAKDVISDTLFVNGAWQDAERWPRYALEVDAPVLGPAIIAEDHATIIVPPNWQLVRSARDDLVLTRRKPRATKVALGTAQSGAADPVLLEVFNARFMAIAEQMGVTLEKTASSVNIKERLDFSCALFDAEGGLIANAPHMPVHLGSMGASVQAVRAVHNEDMRAGDAFVVNAPYAGGTHLPDVTLVLPIFIDDEQSPRFFTAARGHHADIGGVSPGSMPSFSTHIDEEGILFHAFRVRRNGAFDETGLMARLADSPYPARNPAQNRADILAQIAACETGAQNIRAMYSEFGAPTVNAYVGFVQDNAEENVRQVIDQIHDANFEVEMDCGAIIRVTLGVNRDTRTLDVDFTGTSAQMNNNFNAPSAVCRAAVLYVFRCMVDADIPMNEGCLKPINIKIPEGCLLAPEPAAAVVAGNVETSQAICDALFGALGAMAACQGTMNNLTFGNEQLQYYETICGGAGAGYGFHGADAVHTHMTNSRLTDPEVLEWRFPVRLQNFSVRAGTGGSGLWHGGCGIKREIEFLQPMEASLLSGRRKTKPFGLNGGEHGATGRNYLRRNTTQTDLGACAHVTIEAGDILGIETPGGGGYGSVDPKTNR